ncbi:class F sortase, partial [Arthrobacter sp. HMWF013]|uniref:class F sortase n=1 Tax=Arthrobacter sp. HMWF013 TaxID=2056849 RepID=UPI002159CD6F
PSTAQAGDPTASAAPPAATPAPSPAAIPAAVPAAPATLPATTAPVPAPTTLTVAGTSINMTVVPVGVAPGGAMEIPEAFDQAGWYRFGPAPGAGAGTAVIAGHIDTTSEQAPFSQLKTLAAGTAIQVGRQDAPPLVYRVVTVELMAKDSFDGASLFRRAGPHELKVVTCGGRWLDEVKDYSDNVIVTAVLE